MGHTPWQNALVEARWNVNNEKAKSFGCEKGMSENVCYVIIILLHHYPFFVLSKQFRCFRANGVEEEIRSIFEFLSGTLRDEEEQKFEIYFNFPLTQHRDGKSVQSNGIYV